MGRGCPCHLAGRSLSASCLPLARWKPSFGILPTDGFQRRRDSTGNPSRDPHLAWRPVTPRRSVTLVGPSRRDGLSRAARGRANRGSWAKHNRPGGHLTARGGRGAGACSTSVGDFAPPRQRPTSQRHAKYPREETRPARGRANRGAGACSTSVGDFAPLGNDSLASPTRHIPARRLAPPAAGPSRRAACPFFHGPTQSSSSVNPLCLSRCRSRPIFRG